MSRIGYLLAYLVRPRDDGTRALACPLFSCGSQFTIASSAW